MKAIIKHKHIYFIILTLHVLFLSMPVSYAEDIVLCYNYTGQIGIELKSSEECSPCNKNIDDSQEKDSCSCVDIPISKEVDGHPSLLSNGTPQSNPAIYLHLHTANLLNPSYPDGLFALVNSLHLKSTTHESLRTIVLLI